MSLFHLTRQLLVSRAQLSWANLDFIVVPHRDAREVYVLGSVDDIVTQLEDNQATLQTMTASRFIVGIRKVRGSM
jgi:dynein heavy chain